MQLPLLQSAYRKNVRIMNRLGVSDSDSESPFITLSRAHHISAEEPRLGQYDRELGQRRRDAGHVTRMEPDQIPRLLQRCWQERGYAAKSISKRVSVESEKLRLSRIVLASKCIQEI